MQINDSSSKIIDLTSRFNSFYEIIFKITGIKHENISSEDRWIWFIPDEIVQWKEIKRKKIKTCGYGKILRKKQKMSQSIFFCSLSKRLILKFWLLYKLYNSKIEDSINFMP